MVANKNHKTVECSDYLLVMTACIVPNNDSIKVVINDPIIRLEDYRKTLIFWLRYPDTRIGKILFIENSGFPLDSLKETVLLENNLSKQVEFISLMCNEQPPGIHYGYSELNMIDQGLSLSELVKNSRYIIKVTGRLVFPDLTALLKLLPSDYYFAVDCRKNSFFVKHLQEFVTTQLMFFSTDFYELKLRNIKSKMTQKMFLIENLLYSELINYMGSEGTIFRWPINVDPVGYAAHWHKDYRSFKQRLIYFFRGICRLFLPQWWV